MKKYNLFKVLAITVIVAWLLTLFIPGSYLDYSGNLTSAGVSGVGVWAMFSDLSICISYFNKIAVFLIATACLYAVLNKIDLYNAFTEKVTKTFENKKGLFVIITTILFAIFAAVVNDALILIVFMPFIYKVMKGLELDNITVLCSTIVACLVGSMCSIYNATLFGVFSLEVNSLLLVNVITLVLLLAILLFFITPRNKVAKKVVAKKTPAKKVAAKKTDTKAETKKAPVKKVTAKSGKKVNKALYAILTILFGTLGVQKFYAGKVKAGVLSILFCWTLVPTILSIAEFITVLTEKADKDGKINATSERRSHVAYVTSMILFAVFVLFVIIPWESLFTTTVFTDFNTWVSGLKIGNYAVFNNIIGAPVTVDSSTYSSTGVIGAFGTWSMTDVSIFLFLLTGVIALANKFKVNDFVSTVTSGIKKILPVALTAMLISIVLVMMVTTGINVTITHALLSVAKGFNIATATFSTMIGSILTGDFYYFISTLGTVYTSVVTNDAYYGVLGYIIQTVFYLMMLVAPTSVGLVIGLYYLDIPYGKWLKAIWKVLLAFLLVIIVVAVIVYALV